MIRGLPPMPLPVPTGAPANVDPAMQEDFASWLRPSPAVVPTGNTDAVAAPPSPDDQDALALPPFAAPEAGFLPATCFEPSPLAPVEPQPSLPSTSATLPSTSPPPLPLPAIVTKPLSAPSTTPPTDALSTLFPELPAPAPTGGAVLAVLELADGTVTVVPGEGRIEIVSSWRLVADGSLAQIGRAALPYAATDAAHAAHASTTSSVSLPVSTIAAAMRSDAMSVGGRASPVTLTPAVAALRRDVTNADAINAAGNAPSLPATAATWSLRLLRWFEAEGRGATAWLRDYTVAGDGEAGLVDDVRRFAQDAGLPLRRIVLNGRTLWSVESSPQPVSR